MEGFEFSYFSRNGRLQEAESAYRQALALNTEDRVTLKNLAALLYQGATDDLSAGRREAASSRLHEARDLATRALTPNQATSDAQRLLGAVNEQLRALTDGSP